MNPLLLEKARDLPHHLGVAEGVPFYGRLRDGNKLSVSGKKFKELLSLGLDRRKTQFSMLLNMLDKDPSLDAERERARVLQIDVLTTERDSVTRLYGVLLDVIRDEDQFTLSIRDLQELILNGRLPE